MDIKKTGKFTITPEQVASGGNQFQDLVVDQNVVYWSEMRPSEGGRTTILKCGVNREPLECIPNEYDVRTRVHEYGKGAFTVSNGVIYFIHGKDQRLYKLEPSGVPKALTKGNIWFANLTFTSKGLVAVAQTQENLESEPENFLALINVNSGEVTRLAQGCDFYSSPTISEDETKIAWISWKHPNMPWDNTTLWIADFSAQGLSHITQIDESYTEQSFFQPQWDNQNRLWVVSDKSNWWNLYRVDEQKLVPIISFEGEMGQAMWVFGLSTWRFYEKGIAFIHTQSSGGKRLSYFCEGKTKTFDLPFTAFSHLGVMNKELVYFAQSPTHFSSLIRMTSEGKYTVLRQANELTIPTEMISSPLYFAFPSENNRQAYAYFYRSLHSNKRAPLIVICHGGPTAQASDALNLEIQYWTSRGFAIVDVDYAGSTGYGRAYRQSLNTNWGLYDVQDCIAAVEYLIKKDWVDSEKIVMAGSSASGLTVLLALANSHLFSAACVRYGVTDLHSLVKDTHKFESRYLDKLIGLYPQEKEKYEDRSPINQIDNIRCPILFFHGAEDKVVPLAQTLNMIEKLRERGVMCECIVFEGEQHGFRQAKNRVSVLTEQQKFYENILDFNHDR